jgi:hypothetical protein
MSDPFASIRSRASAVEVVTPMPASLRGKKHHAFSTNYAKACGQKAKLKARVQG